MKLHFTLNHAGYLPEALVITTGKYSELTIAHRTAMRQTILTMDKGFLDFRSFYRLDKSGVFFVTQIKDDTRYEVVERCPVTSAQYVFPLNGFTWPRLAAASAIPISSGSSPSRRKRASVCSS